MELFNEATTVILVYFLTLFSDAVPSPETHFILGWWFCLIVIFNITVHFCLMAAELRLAGKIWYQKIKISKKFWPGKNLAQIAKEKAK